MFDVVPDSYAIENVLIRPAQQAGNFELFFGLNRELAAAHSGKLRLHVCNAQYAIDDAWQLRDIGGRIDYGWSYAGIEWPAAATVSLALSLDPSNDAALSALALVDDMGAAVALNDAFDPVEVAYTASVASSVGQVTVMPATRDAYAAVDYLDVNGDPLADADPDADGFQVDLEVGENVVRVKVGATDGTTTETYTVTMSLAAPGDSSLSALELADDDGGAIALNEPFDPDTLMYTVSVANPVPWITVMPAVNDPNAAGRIPRRRRLCARRRRHGRERPPGRPGGRRQRLPGAGDGIGRHHHE